ncbi:hypothetical protein NHX12_022044, partial [Muraenolepis orangiensis]
MHVLKMDTGFTNMNCTLGCWTRMCADRGVLSGPGCVQTEGSSLDRMCADRGVLSGPGCVQTEGSSLDRDVCRQRGPLWTGMCADRGVLSGPGCVQTEGSSLDRDVCRQRGPLWTGMCADRGVLSGPGCVQTEGPLWTGMCADRGSSLDRDVCRQRGPLWTGMCADRGVLSGPGCVQTEGSSLDRDVAICADVKEVLLSDGNEKAIHNVRQVIQRNREAGVLGSTHVSARVVRWDSEADVSALEGHFDIVIQVFWGMALVFAPRRRDTLAVFCGLAQEAGLCVSQHQQYDSQVWDVHLKMQDEGKDAYDDNIHYPILLTLTKGLQPPPLGHA